MFPMNEFLHEATILFFSFVFSLLICRAVGWLNKFVLNQSLNGPALYERLYVQFYTSISVGKQTRAYAHTGTQMDLSSTSTMIG